MANTLELVRGADVTVRKTYGTKSAPIANIVVNDKYQHSFSHKSRVSKHLSLVEPEQLADRLSGGTFMFINDELVDFRDGAYNGFVHEDDTIKAFYDTLGFQRRSELEFKHSRKRAEDEVSSDPYVLRKVWDKNEIIVPGYQTGGDFHSQLSYTWNPFVKTVNSSFDLIRLICENGAIGLTSFLNTKVPVVNRWDEHLNIATRQIQNKVERIVIDRIQNMATERVSVADLLLLEQHTKDRWTHAEDSSERSRLQNIVTAVSPKENLKDVYRFGVFEDKNLSAQLPGHLTAFDAYNIATELRTHTNPTSKSTDNALDKFANVLLFDRQSNYNATSKVTKRTSSFSDPTKAFFGEAA